MKNNNVTPAFNGTSFSLRARATGNGGLGQTFHKLYLQGAGTDVATTWNGNNNLVGAAANAGAVNTTISGTFGTNVFSSTNASPVALATCAVPDNPVPTSIPNLVQENVNGITSNESIAIQDSQSIMSENSGKEAIEKSEIEENQSGTGATPQTESPSSSAKVMAGETIMVNGSGRMNFKK